MKDDNPKTRAAVNKLTMHCVPVDFERRLGVVMQGGADKYGVLNWRDDPIHASTYYDALRRHIGDWYEGLDADEESGEHPLVHLAASCAVVFDAIQSGTLVDDRPVKGDKDE